MRAIIIVLDGVGIGQMPDAYRYCDDGSNTLENIEKQRPLNLPNLLSMGLGHIDNVSVFKTPKMHDIVGGFGKMAEASNGKDTITGHWEIAGLLTKEPFPTFPDGFPADIMQAFQEIAGIKALGNCVASGTDILKSLGKMHMKTGAPIVYTSADSVFQVAAHESIIPLPELYRICQKMRKFLQEPYHVSRVIARPFTGNRPQTFARTKNRRDFSLLPHGDTILTLAARAGFAVSAIGKIEDIFSMEGITDTIHTTNNEEGLLETLHYLEQSPNGIIFTNLIDYDMLYGHRNDVEGFALALEYFDSFLPRLIEGLKDDDLLFITADHGCDPTFKGTDHTREYVPLFVCSKKIKHGINLGIRNSFADIAATIKEYFGLSGDIAGESFLKDLSLPENEELRGCESD